MKKKSLIVLMTVTLVIAAFGLVGPASAKQPDGGRALFEADIVPATIDGHPLDKGEVWIRMGGLFKVEIEGAAVPIEGVRVEVFLMNSNAPTVVHLGTIDIDEEGEGMLDGLVPVSGVTFANPWIEIHYNRVVHYVSGFDL